MEDNRIPLARSVRWRRIRSRTIPVLSFLAAVMATGWLWRFHAPGAQVIGEVDSPRVDVTSPTAGLVLAMPHQTRGQWTVYDHVQAGDVIARIEDQQLESSKRVLREEIQQLIQEIGRQLAAPGGGEVASPSEAEPAWRYEQSRLELLDGQLAAGSMPGSGASQEALAEAEAESSAAVAAGASEPLAQARERRRALEQRGAVLARQSATLEIPAPISGTLVAVHCWPGQMLPPGGLIATIAADHGRHIVGYIPEDSRLVARPGMEVTLRTRMPGAPRVASAVEEVGRQIERIPRHQRTVSTTPQWGTPVRIKMPSDSSLRPGALVDIFFERPTAN